MNFPVFDFHCDTALVLLGDDLNQAGSLRKKRYKILASGYRCRFGEIDLIVSNRSYLVFVEVKLRKSADFAAAREYVDGRKQDRLRATASMYLAQNPTNLRCRFDIIEIYAPDGMNTVHPEINHMEDAFQ